MGFFNDRKYGFLGPKRKKGKDSRIKVKELHTEEVW